MYIVKLPKSATTKANIMERDKKDHNCTNAMKKIETLKLR